MKWAVLVSGSGTILESMIAEAMRPDLVLADRACRAIEIAEAAGIPVIIVDRRKFGFAHGAAWDRPGFSVKVASILNKVGISLTAMAGFDTILGSAFFDKYAGMLLNTHPALLPAFKGLYGKHVIQAALDARVVETGCTIHVATADVDNSRSIVAQKTVPVFPGDDVEMLWERIKAEERKLYPQVVRDILAGNLVLK